MLAAHPELTAINRAIAFTYGREKNHPEALKYLDLALTANPNDATLLQLAAASAMEVSDYPRAMGYLGTHRRGGADRSRPDGERGDEPAEPPPIDRSGGVADAHDRQVPGGADAYFYRGYASMQAGKPAEARPDLEQYVKLAPPDAPLVGTGQGHVVPDSVEQ